MDKILLPIEGQLYHNSKGVIEWPLNRDDSKVLTGVSQILLDILEYNPEGFKRAVLADDGLRGFLEGVLSPSKPTCSVKRPRHATAPPWESE